MLVVACLSGGGTQGAVPCGGSVFEDAQLWIRGFRDTKGKGTLSAYADVPNALDATNKVPGIEYYNQGSDAVLRDEDVFCPYANTTLAAQPCCYLKQAVNAEGKGYFASFGTRVKNGGKVCITNGVATVVARVRPEAPLITSKMWLFGNIGFQFGFATNVVNGVPSFYLQGYDPAGTYQSSTIYVNQGEWLDVAAVKTGTKIHFYAVTNNSALLTQSFTVKETSNVYSNFFFGYNSNGNWGLTNSGRPQSFRGTIHQLAVWNRVLSESEIREAFGFPRKDVWSAGLPNKSAGEFVMTNPGATAADPHDWHSVPSALPQGVASSFAFDLTALQSPLPQLLRLTAMPDSPTGSIAVSANGKSVGSFVAKPGECALLLVPTNVLVTGANTLTLTRTDAGTTTIDALSFGGSWQLGYDGYTYSEFGPDGLAGYANCGDFKLVGRAMHGEETNVVHVVMSKEEAEEYSWDFTVQVYTSHGFANHPQPLQADLLVNGEPLKRVTFTQQYQTPFRVRIPAGKLKEGDNVLGFNYLLSKSVTNRWLCMDYWRMTVVRHPEGLSVIVR